MTKLIDLFAGPGGLGEGFSAFKDRQGQRPFRLAVSIEKEQSAHATLTLRAFLRQFDPEDRPEEFEAYRQGKIDKSTLISKFPQQFAEAMQETLGRPCALGEDNQLIENRIADLKSGGSEEPWVVIGGPPCQAYSLAGRSRNRGILNYRPEKDDRNFLYREYLRILALARPHVFIMENVRGILSAKVAGRSVFPDILEDLRNPGKAEDVTDSRDLRYQVYSLVVDGDDLKPEDYLIKAENYGVPQRRHRVILVGVRSDIKRKPNPLKLAESRVSVNDVIGMLPRLRSKVSRAGDSPEQWQECIDDGIQRLLHSGALHSEQLKKAMYGDLNNLGFKLPTKAGRYDGSVGTSFGQGVPESLAEWLKGSSQSLGAHEARGHMPSDLVRYFFASSFTAFNNGNSPKAKDFPAALAPDHANWRSGKFADRFRVQAGISPSTTVTSHISKDGHYFIHPDPRQCRSLTVREAARLQTFPDDYHFEGNRTQQYVQVGNAVPPYLARQIAEIVHQILFD